MAFTRFTGLALRQICSGTKISLLDSIVLARCRDLDLVKKRTHRGYRGGRGKLRTQRDGPVAASSGLLSDSSQDFLLTLAGLCDTDSETGSVCGHDHEHQCSLSSEDSNTTNKSHSVVIGLWNAQSSRKKNLDICDLILEKLLDILVITETWLYERGDEAIITGMTPAGYVFSQRARSSGQDGGGIALIHRNSLHVTACIVNSFKSFECMEFVISCGKQSVRTVAVYRPPPSDKNELKDRMFHEDFGPFVSSISNKNLLILGDFNFHWNNPSNANTRLMMQLLDSADLVQHVDGPTQRCGNTLDWVISRSDQPVLVYNLVVENLALSDHFLVRFETNMVRPAAPKKTIQARSLKKMNMESFKQDLAQSELVTSPPPDVDQLVQLYYETLSSLLDVYAPVKTMHIPERPDTAWFTPSVHVAKKARRRAEKRWKKSGLEVHRQMYKQQRNHCTQVIRAAKSAHVQSVLEAASSDSRTMFSVVNQLLGKKSTTPVLPDLSDAEAADTLNTFFVDKVQQIRAAFDDDLPGVQLAFSGDPLTDFSPVTEEQLRKIIAASRPTSSVVDPIPTKIVLDCLDILLPVLVLIVNMSLSSSSVPKLFKASVVKPLLKKNELDPNKCKNFRPVSNLPFVSKLLEKVVAQQLLSHLREHGLLDKFQSAYRPGHSCETALLRLLNDVLCSIDNGDLVLLVLLDLSAAFDVIDHDLLLSRLHCEVGISGSAHQWFCSYLRDRTQRVIVNQASSTDTLVTCGVPQGSVLGPFLFSIYTSQLGRLIESHAVCRKLFADDTELYKSFHPDDTSAAKAVLAVENCCQEIKSWMAVNRLKLNDDKTEAILCGSKANLMKVAIDSAQVGASRITLSKTVRDLGFLVDSTLSMVPQVSSVVSSCYFHLRALGQLRPQLNKKTANAVAVALIQSRLDFCNSCLWGITDIQLQKLKKVQNTAARIVTRTKKTEHITPVLSDLHWLPIHKRIDHKLLSLVYSCVDGSAPEYLRELVSRYDPPRRLRSYSKFLLREPSVEGHKKKTQGARSFECIAPKLWNRLPQRLREAPSKDSFKRQLKTHLFSQ